MRRPTIGVLVISLGLAISVGLSIWEGYQPWPSAAAHWSVAAVVAVTLGLAAVLGARRQAEPGLRWATATGGAVRRWLRHRDTYGIGVAVWIAFVVGFFGWDLLGLLDASKSFPTFSRLVGHVTKVPIGRAAVFGLWLVVGARLVVAGRRPRRTPGARGPGHPGARSG